MKKKINSKHNELLFESDQKKFIKQKISKKSAKTAKSSKLLPHTPPTTKTKLKNSKSKKLRLIFLRLFISYFCEFLHSKVRHTHKQHTFIN